MKSGTAFVFAILSIVPHVSAAFGTDAAAPAAGVLASIRPPVRVERGGSSAAPVELGMRLEAGDVVSVGSGGAAVLYLAGSGIIRVAEGSRFALPTAGGPGRGAAHAAGVSPGAMKASESGLWILNDPQGSILVAAMRGGADPAWSANEIRAVPLSPRYESAPSRRPRFVAAGGPRPIRIAVASGKEIVWRSKSLDGDGPWSPVDFPDLTAAKVYSWRLESAGDGSPLSEWASFRVPSAADAASIAAFEAEMASLAQTADGGSAADLLRCGRYLDASSWTPLLCAATRLLALQPDSTVAKRARDRAIAGLHLDASDAAALAKALD